MPGIFTDLMLIPRVLDVCGRALGFGFRVLREGLRV